LPGLVRTVNKTGALTIGYSTLADRVRDIKFSDEFTNLVVIQNPSAIDIPDLGSEVKVFQLSNTGVAKSRNAAIENTKTDYLLFGDDDVIFKSQGLLEVIDYLEAHPDISIIMAQAVNEKGALRKHYPRKSHALKLTNSAKAATYEMIIRVSDIKAAGIRFDENFGAGAANYLGDEYIFIVDSIRAGLKGEFKPIVIATHPTESSGTLRNLAKDRTARAKVFTRVFGIWAPGMRLLFIVKPPFKKFGLFNSLLFILGK